MPEARSTVAAHAAAVPLCRADELAERGRAHVWDLLHFGRPARGFALRFEGAVVAYLNRCLHVAAEMDWREGEFLDADARFIVCSIHGATYEPADGRCVGGPCGRGRLERIEVAERDGMVCWYPSRDLTPLAFDEGAADTAPDAQTPHERGNTA